MRALRKNRKKRRVTFFLSRDKRRWNGISSRKEITGEAKSKVTDDKNLRLKAESKVIQERNLRLKAEQVLQSNWIDELEKEKEQARRYDLLEQEKRVLESDLLKARNQGLEAELMVIEERNRRLEAERMVQVKWIDELEKEKEQARRNDLQRESELLKERNQRLEAEIHADSHLNHTLKVFFT